MEKIHTASIKYIALIFVLLISSQSISSCNRNRNQENELPGIDISLQDMNKSFKIIEPQPQDNSHKNGERLFLQVQNLSVQTIIFPKGYGVEIFYKDGDPNASWTIAGNRIIYPEISGYTLLSFEEYHPGLGLIVYPYILGLREETTVKVVMIGHYEDGNTESQGAYIDITLQP